MSPLHRLPLAAITLWLVAACGAAGSQAASASAEPKRLLIVVSHQSTLPAVQEFDRGLLGRLHADGPPDLQLYTEYLDLVRFPGPDHRRRQVDNLAAKTRGLKIDVVLAVGTAALRLMLENRDSIAPGARLIFGGVMEGNPEKLDAPPDVAGVVGAYDLPGTVRLAEKLQPEARRLVVVTGSGGYDRMWENAARGVFGDRFDGLSVDYVTGLPLDGFVSMARGLGDDAILLFLCLFEDADGRRFTPRDAGGAIAAAAGAPAFTVYSTLVGQGFVGGVAATFEDMGAAAGDLALLTLNGRPPESQVTRTPSAAVVDWRALERWGLDPGRLPLGARIEFRELSAWDRYRFEILAALTLLTLQSATIAGLVVTERRRRRIKDELTEERLELAHLSRTSQLGALSGSFAHELNQPLTAILANAEAGARLARQEPADIEEIRAILDDIAEDDRRAASVIAQLRPMMLKGEAKLEPVDLNAAAASTIALARSEMAARGARVDFRGEGDWLPVMGNLVQLKQIVLNLMMNAAESMADLPPARRRIEVATRRRRDGWAELSVADDGPGLSPELRADAFRPFVSGKSDGMGLGLSICRTIAQAHGGTLEFDAERTAGARIVLSLPPMKETA